MQGNWLGTVTRLYGWVQTRLHQLGPSQLIWAGLDPTQKNKKKLCMD
jgi:hypothetical protein